MSLTGLFKSDGPNGFGYSTTAEEVTRGLSLQGQTVLVTGCASGLGKESLRVLAKAGARVIGTARTLEKAKAACEAVEGETFPVACELADPVSVRSCVESLKRSEKKLDALLCNAGIMALPRPSQAFGIELQFFTNHVGHFLLVNGLLGLLAESGRVVMVSSGAHWSAPKEGIQFDNLSGEKGYSPWRAYGQSKIANVLFAKELARRFSGTKRVAVALHPGVIRTNLGRHMNPVANTLFGVVGPLFLKSIPQGAATQVYAAVHPQAASLSGAYLKDCNVARSRRDADDPALARRLWEETERLTARLPAAAG